MQHRNEKWQAGRKRRDETSETVTPVLPPSPALFLCASENKWTAKGREVPKIASLECTSTPLLLPVIASRRGNWSSLVHFFFCCWGSVTRKHWAKPHLSHESYLKNKSVLNAYGAKLLPSLNGHANSKCHMLSGWTHCVSFLFFFQIFHFSKEGHATAVVNCPPLVPPCWKKKPPWKWLSWMVDEIGCVIKLSFQWTKMLSSFHCKCIAAFCALVPRHIQPVPF